MPKTLHTRHYHRDPRVAKVSRAPGGLKRIILRPGYALLTGEHAFTVSGQREFSSLRKGLVSCSCVLCRPSGRPLSSVL